MPVQACSTPAKPLIRASANSCRPLVISVRAKFDCFGWFLFQYFIHGLQVIIMSLAKVMVPINLTAGAIKFWFGRQFFLAIWRPALRCSAHIGGSALRVYYLWVAAVVRAF